MLHSILRGKVNKFSLCTNNGERIQIFDEVISYSYSTGPGIMFKAELVRHPNVKN